MYEKAGGALIYRGDWLNGLFHGQGFCVERQNGNVRITYDGDFHNGLRHGFGTLQNDHNGVTCRGRWHCDKAMNAKWRIMMADGCIYSGDVKVREEKGNLEVWTTFPGSDMPPIPRNFEISTPQPHGFGAMKYSNGDIFIGSFVDGDRKGTGSLFVNEQKIEGTWEGDQLIDKPGNDSFTS